MIEQARSEGIGTPIVVVSARGTEHDRINALELGADDYLVKPFSMKELAARVAAAARRGTRAQEPRRGDEINVEELRLDPRNVQAYIDGESAELTPTEFRLIYALALDQGRVLTRDELLQRVWGRRASHRDRTVDVFVRKLREKIDARSRRTRSSRRATASATSSTPLRSRPRRVRRWTPTAPRTSSSTACPATTSSRTTSSRTDCACTTSTRAPARRCCCSTASRRGRTSTARSSPS